MLAEDTKYIAILDRAKQITDQVDRVVVEDDDSLAKAGDLSKLITTVKNSMEDYRRSAVQPMNEAVKKLNSEAKGFIAPIVDAQDRLKKIMNVYVQERASRAQEEARAQAKEAEENALRDAQILSDAGQEAAAEAVMDSAGRGASTHVALSRGVAVRGTAVGSTTSERRTWKWRISNANNIPRAFLVVDEKALNDVIRSAREEANTRADRAELKGKERDAYVQGTMQALLRGVVSGVEYFEEITAGVR